MGQGDVRMGALTWRSTRRLCRRNGLHVRTALLSRAPTTLLKPAIATASSAMRTRASLLSIELQGASCQVKALLRGCPITTQGAPDMEVTLSGVAEVSATRPGRLIVYRLRAESAKRTQGPSGSAALSDVCPYVPLSQRGLSMCVLRLLFPQSREYPARCRSSRNRPGWSRPAM